MAKIFIIGMPGSGKSTTGRLLAKDLGYAFIDLDLEIEVSEGATIEAIFELRGQAYFRQIEAQVLGKVANREGDFVIATGGGSPCYYNGLTLMKEKGKTVFIDATPDTLVQRLKNDTLRPLLKDGIEDRIKQLYTERIDVYSKAEIIIKADQLTSNEVADLVMRDLE